MTTRNILWERWKDPIQPLINKKKGKSQDRDDDEDDPEFRAAKISFGVEDSDHDGDGPEGIGPCVVSSAGVIPIHEGNLPSTLYNFWMGHTDFNVTKRILKTIKKVPGVETIDVFSRYRFRIAIGKLFKHRDVKHAIEASVQEIDEATPLATDTNSLAESIRKMKANLSKVFDFWSIYIRQDGTLVGFGGLSESDLNDKINATTEQLELVTSSAESKE